MLSFLSTNAHNHLATCSCSGSFRACGQFIPTYWDKLPSHANLNSSCLTFGYSFNQQLDQYSIPSSVRRLTFGHNFNQVLDQYSIPSSITYLTFGYSFS